MTSADKYNLLRYFLSWAKTARRRKRIDLLIAQVEESLGHGDGFDRMIENVRKTLGSMDAEQRPEALFRRFIEADEQIQTEAR